MTTVYIAGPMKGYPGLNWNAFDSAQEHLESLGYRVINPAELDREMGFIPSDIWGPVQPHQALRDIGAVSESDIVALLPNWHRSMGAKAEVAFARWTGKKVLPLSRIKKL